MGFSSPKIPAPPPLPPPAVIPTVDTAKAAALNKDEYAGVQGRAATVLTSAKGAMDKPQVGLKSLLGA